MDLFAAAMPVLHMRGVHYAEIARSTGGFFFVWTLWALGGLGGCVSQSSSRHRDYGVSYGERGTGNLSSAMPNSEVTGARLHGVRSRFESPNG